MIINVSGATALQSALAGAHSGDTILLAPGNYGTVNFNNLHFATDVTIASAGTPALFTGLKIANSNGLTFQNLELKLSVEGAFTVTASQDVHFDDLSVHGSLDGNARNDVGGMLIRTSSDVSVANSEFQQLITGVAHLDSDHVTITGNSIHDIRMDGIRGGGSDYVTISNNTIGKFWPASGDHSDAIQFWTSGAKAATIGIVITDNVYMRGAGGGATTQGIFLGDESGHGYKDVTITGNLIAGGVYNGIWVKHVQNLDISDNIVAGFTDMKSFIYYEKVTGGSVTDNIANQYVPKTVTGVTVGGNATIPLASDQGAAVYAQWLADHDAPPPPPGEGLNLPGTAANDVLTAGAGADTLGGAGGTDTLTGGAGDDAYVLTNAASKVVEAAGGGVDTVRSSVGGFTLADNVEHAVLTGTAMRVTGNALDNQLTGNAATNTLTGMDGADTLDGAAGADSLTGGEGADVLIGGAGADKFYFVRSTGNDTIRDFGAGGEADALDIASFLKAGLNPTLTDLGADLKVSFSSGEFVILQGVDAADLTATTTGYIFA